MAEIASIDNRTKSLVEPANHPVGDADVSKRMSQRQVLGRHEMGGDRAVDGRVLGRHVDGVGSRYRRPMDVDDAERRVGE